MNNTTEILSYFEKRLNSKINPQNMTRVDGTEQTSAGRMITTIKLEIDTEELAEEVYIEICKLIENNDRVEKIGWFKFSGTNKWCFQFSYAL